MRDRIDYFDNFRAIAILIIITGHCYIGWNRQQLWEWGVSNAITGGTALFVFISGFFLHAVFAKNMEYAPFIKKKFINVVQPYLFLTLGHIGLVFALTGTVPVAFDPNMPSNFTRLMYGVFTGLHVIAYWYIPFVFLLFLITPVFMKFMKLDRRVQVSIIGVGFAISSVVHRAKFGMNPFHDLVYFTPYYLFGIVYSQNRKAFETYLKKNVALIGAAWLFVVVFMTSIGERSNAVKFNPFEFTGFDWMIPQKILLILFILAALLTFANRRVASLKYIADISFPLFFVHPLVVEISLKSNARWVLPENALGFVVYAWFVTCASIFIIRVIKSLLGQHSRRVFGA